MTDAQIHLAFVALVRLVYSVTASLATLTNHTGIAAVYRDAAWDTGRLLPTRAEVLGWLA